MSGEPMREEENQERAEKILLVNPPRTLKEMTREERRAWAYALHQKIVYVMTTDELNYQEK